MSGEERASSPDGGDAPLGEARRCVTGPTPHMRRDRERVEELALAGRASTTTSPSGLATCDAIFARCLVRAAPTEIGRPTSSRTRRPDRGGDRRRRPEEVRRARDVEERLVDRDPLHRRREVAEDRHHLVAQPLVLLEVPPDEDQVGAELPRLPSGHPALHAESLGLVRRRQHHARRRPPRVAPAATGRAVARPTRRTRRGRRGGSTGPRPLHDPSEHMFGARYSGWAG